MTEASSRAAWATWQQSGMSAACERNIVLYMRDKASHENRHALHDQRRYRHIKLGVSKVSRSEIQDMLDDTGGQQAIFDAFRWRPRVDPATDRIIKSHFRRAQEMSRTGQLVYIGLMQYRSGEIKHYDFPEFPEDDDGEPIVPLWSSYPSKRDPSIISHLKARDRAVCDITQVIRPLMIKHGMPGHAVRLLDDLLESAEFCDRDYKPGLNKFMLKRRDDVWRMSGGLEGNKKKLTERRLKKE